MEQTKETKEEVFMGMVLGCFIGTILYFTKYNNEAMFTVTLSAVIITTFFAFNQREILIPYFFGETQENEKEDVMTIKDTSPEPKTELYY